MLTLSDYLSKLTSWSGSNYKNNGIVCPDSAFYQGSCLTNLQKADLGLLLQTLLKDDANRLHLRCHEWQQIDEFFGTILATLCFYKYAQNQTETPVTELYKAGTVIYNPRKKEARVVKGNHSTGVITRPVKEETIRVKGERHTQAKTLYPTFDQLAKYIPLANISEHTFNRNTLENLDDYFDLFNNTLCQYRALTQFPRRLLVVTPYSTVQQLPRGTQFPIRYQFNKNYTVPVVSPLVEIVNRYDDARDKLRKEGSSIDEVVVLGDIGYRESINSLLNDLSDGYFKRVIILGCQPIQSDYNFQCWPWSSTERTLLRVGKTTNIERILLPSEGLKKLRPLFVESASQLVAIGLTEAEANGSLNQLIGQHLRDALVNGPALIRYQETLLNEPDSVWRSWFEEAGQHDNYPAFCELVLTGLRKVADYIASNRTKLSKIVELASRHQTENKGNSQTWIVVRPKQAEALNEYFTNNKVIKAISYRELKTLLAKPANGKSEQFVFPTLHLNYQPSGNLLRDYCLYHRAIERGTGYILAYEDMEDGLAKLCEWLYQRDEHLRITYPDRQYWVNFSCGSKLPVQLPQTGMSGLLEPLLSTETENIGGLIDELELLDDNDAEQPTRTAEVLLKLNESFTRYFGVWKDIRKSRSKAAAKARQQAGEGIRNAISDSDKNGKRYWIRFDDHNQNEYKESEWLAKVHGDQVIPTATSNIQKGDLIVHFAIKFDSCLEALKTIPEADEALKEAKWASRAWRNWLRSDVDFFAFSKKCSQKEARKARYQKLVQLVQTVEPTVEFVQFRRFEQWLDQPSDYIFPRTISHLQLILETHLNQIPPADKPTKQLDMERIMAARDQSASFREVVTKLDTELTHYLVNNNKGKILSNIPDQFLSDLLKTRVDRKILSIESL